MNLLSLILMISILGSEFKEGENQLMNGFEALQRDFNYHVFIFVNRSNTCTGGIIDTTHVITAAHCVYYCDADAILMIAGVTKLRSNASVVRLVKKIYIPENFVNDSIDDIAVLKLRTPFVFGENIGAIPLPSAPVPDEEKICWFTGFEQNGPIIIDWKLSWIPLELIPNIVCECMTQLFVPPRIFCAIDVYETAEPSIGDSGGVLVCDGVAVGIIFGRVSNRMHTPNLFSSIYDHLDFIRTAIASTGD